MSLRQAQSEISSREFTEWMAYARLEPFGEDRADLRIGILASLIANINRDKKRKQKPFTPQDFMPKWDEAYEEPEVLTPEETLERVKAIQKQLSILQQAGAR